MLGRNSYTRQELDHAQTAVKQQLASYTKLVKAISGATSDQRVDAARAAFETQFFNNMVIVLDRYFVHRVRNVTGKDGNPVNEVELLAESLMNNNGILRTGTVVKLVPAESVTKTAIGGRIRLDAATFKRLADAYFAEIERRFV